MQFVVQLWWDWLISNLFRKNQDISGQYRINFIASCVVTPPVLPLVCYDTTILPREDCPLNCCCSLFAVSWTICIAPKLWLVEAPRLDCKWKLHLGIALKRLTVDRWIVQREEVGWCFNTFWGLCIQVCWKEAGRRGRFLKVFATVIQAKHLVAHVVCCWIFAV